MGAVHQRWKKYFSFCHPGIIVQYFLLLSRNFKWGLCTYILKNLMISVLLKRYYSKMSIKSWFCIFLLDYRWNITCFFYVLEIFSAKFWFWKYFLSSRMTGFTTFSTSGAEFGYGWAGPQCVSEYKYVYFMMLNNPSQR